MWLQVLNTFSCLRSHLRSCCIHWCLTARPPTRHNIELTLVFSDYWRIMPCILNRYILLLSTHFKLPAQPPIFSDIVLMYRILCFEKPPDNNGLLPLAQCLAQPCQKKKEKKEICNSPEEPDVEYCRRGRREVPNSKASLLLLLWRNVKCEWFFSPDVSLNWLILLVLTIIN